jgi:hypothetical protein
MVKFMNNRYAQYGFLILYLLIALAVWRAFMFEFRLDDSFITYRYARNFAEGKGLVYNQGDSVLSTTAPLYAILLSVLSIIVSDFHTLGNIIGALSIGVSGWLVYQILPQEMPTGIRFWAGLIYTLSSPLWLALGMETALWIALILGAICLSQNSRWGWSGLLVGLAVLTRPDAVLAGKVLGLVILVITINRLGTTRQWWRPLTHYVITASLPIIIFVIWAIANYGSPLPVTLAAKSAQAELGITGLGVGVDYTAGLGLVVQSLVAQSPLYLALFLLMLFGLSGRLAQAAVITGVWGLLHFIAYTILQVAPYRWYYAPLVPGVVMIAATGLNVIWRRLSARNAQASIGLISAIALFPLIAQFECFNQIYQQIQFGGPTDVMLPIVDWEAYRETGEWIAQQTPPEATVGVAEVGQLGFYARRYMTDYLGLLQPDVSAMLNRGDLYSWLVGYAPDYLIFQRFRGAALVLYNYVIEDDSWFKASYRVETEFDDPRYSSGPVTVFRRVTTLPDLEAIPAQLDYDGLRLVGVMTDANALTSEGGTVRVRLDWQVIGDLPPDLHIAVKGLDMAGGNPGFDGDYQTLNWEGVFSTWHGFVVPQGVVPNQYILLVGVGPKGGPYLDQGVGTITVHAGD